MDSLKMVGITELYKESCQTRKNISNIYILMSTPSLEKKDYNQKVLKRQKDILTNKNEFQSGFTLKKNSHKDI